MTKFKEAYKNYKEYCDATHEVREKYRGSATIGNAISIAFVLGIAGIYYALGFIDRDVCEYDPERKEDEPE